MLKSGAILQFHCLIFLILSLLITSLYHCEVHNPFILGLLYFFHTQLMIDGIVLLSFSACLISLSCFSAVELISVKVLDLVLFLSAKYY